MSYRYSIGRFSKNVVRKVNGKCIGAQIEIQEILVGGKKKNPTVKVIEVFIQWRMLPRDVVEPPSLRMVET